MLEANKIREFVNQKQYRELIVYLKENIDMENGEYLSYLADAYRCNNDRKNAILYFELAAMKGDAFSMGYLAQVYYIDLKQDELAYNWALKGAELNNLQSWYILGRICKDHQDYENAFICFTRGIEKEECQIELGFAYHNGHGVPKDDYKAYEYFYKNKHHQDAQVMLGQAHYDGKGCMQSYPLAFQYYEQAANSGHVIAMGNLAHLYYAGIGVEKNDERVYYWATKAAQNNDATGYHYLGALYAQGLYVHKDDYQAVYYFDKAATLGDPVSQYWLAMAYKEGKGTSKKYLLYVEWIKKSANQGYQPAIDEYNNYQRSGFNFY